MSYPILLLIFFNPLHNHTFNASTQLISSCSNVHVSHPYNTTGHTNTFTILVFNYLLNPFVKSSFFLLNASFAIAILVFTSLCLHPSSVITESKYLKLLTCSILCPSTVMVATPPSSQRTIPLLLFLEYLSSCLSFLQHRSIWSLAFVFPFLYLPPYPDHLQISYH